MKYGGREIYPKEIRSNLGRRMILQILMVIMIRRNGMGWNHVSINGHVLDISGDSASAFRQEAEWNSGLCIVLLQNRRLSNPHSSVL